MSIAKYKYVAEIPARIGSNRVKKKNIRLLNGRPMIQYSIEACNNASKIDKVFVNTDSDLIGQIAIDNGAEYYERKKHLASDTAKQDEFNYDFLKNTDCEVIVMVNPVSPLIESCDIDNAIDYFERANIDTLISVKKEQLHAFYQSKPLNFDTNILLPATQDIDPVLICTWNICIWKKEVFVKSFETEGHAAFSGVIGQWAIDPIKAIKISYEEDFRMAEDIIKARECISEEYKAQYYDKDLLPSP